MDLLPMSPKSEEGLQREESIWETIEYPRFCKVVQKQVLALYFQLRNSNSSFLKSQYYFLLGSESAKALK